ncbi:glycosyltransferase [Flavobacterium franklandianum]|uniref:glycosyltransferase n=1 Tax=Flavobacterium franklandianum TaxID=2594430 RepID=UPI00117B075E|nr:glycosyltransferase [Flavobacterium franklandianum]TRX23164.1 glycosyltransferase [Flavobacterium franklandianum]
MIRVLNIIETISSGGVERRRLSMAKLLDKSTFELKIICTNSYGSFADEIRKHGVEVIEIGSLTNFLDVKQHLKVQKIIADFKPHIIHGAIFEGVTMAAINGFWKRVPIIILEETSDPQTRSWKGNLLMKALTLLAHKVIGVSPAATNYLINTLKIGKNKVALITNGIATPRTVSLDETIMLKKQLNISEHEIVIGSIGRMTDDANKRFSDLINAFAILVKKQLPVKLILVGDGVEKKKYIQQVQNLGLQKQVFFAGYQADTSLYYSIFDVFSLVSSHESFGLVLAEAMFHKLPIVATKVGGMKYIVDDKETGFLVEKYDVKSIASKLETLCENKQLRQEFGQKGFLKATQNYTEERYVNTIKELYSNLVTRHFRTVQPDKINKTTQQ